MNYRRPTLTRPLGTLAAFYHAHDQTCCFVCRWLFLNLGRMQRSAQKSAQRAPQQTIVAATIATLSEFAVRLLVKVQVNAGLARNLLSIVTPSNARLESSNSM